MFKGDREYRSSPTEVHRKCRTYVVISCLRWIMITTVVFSLSVPMQEKISSYYRSVSRCQTCLAHARLDLDNLYEFGRCSEMNVTELRTANEPNLLRQVYFNLKFSASSDVSDIVGVTSFLYTMSVIVVIAFFIFMVFWLKANDPESALNMYLKYSLMVNSLVALFSNYQLLFSQGLVMNDECYIDAFPREAGFTVIIGMTMMFVLSAAYGLTFVFDCCTCCATGGRKALVVLTGIFMLIALSASSIITGMISSRSGPAFVAALGILNMLFALEIWLYAAVAGRCRLLVASEPADVDHETL